MGELFASSHATAIECAVKLIQEIFLRYGFTRQVISGICPQYVNSSVSKY